MNECFNLSVLAAGAQRKGPYFECEAIYSEALTQCATRGEVPTFTGNQSAKIQNQFNEKVRKQAKSTILLKHTQESHDKIKFLVVQGKNIAVAAAEEGDLL